MTENLSFKELQEACVERSNSTAFDHDLEDWSLQDWTNALAGETGELCNFTKKMKRDKIDYTPECGAELADIVIYATIIAAHMGLDLETEVRRKFNSVSDKRGVEDIKI